MTLTATSINHIARRCLRPIMPTYHSELTAPRLDEQDDGRGLLVTDGSHVYAVRKVVQKGFYGYPIALVQRIVLCAGYPVLDTTVQARNAGCFMLWQEAMDVPQRVVDAVYSKLEQQDAYMLLMAGK